MAEHSAIEWTDATFNPWWGCQKVSPACDHCYAERDAARFAPGRVLWGVGAERRTFGEKHWAEPLKWARRLFFQCDACGWRGTDKQAHNIRIGEASTALACPRCEAIGASHVLRVARQRVFCASMADWLDLDAPLDQFVRLLDTIRGTPELDWLLLSKRIGNWRKRLDEAVSAVVAANGSFGGVSSWAHDWLCGKPPANVWIGATVVDQAEADRDVPKLLATPARVRFLSIEPMLGPITLPGFNATTSWCPLCAKIVPDSLVRPHEGEHGSAALPCASVYDMLHWVIAGGESGPHARPAHPAWFAGLRDQCAAADVPFLHKQNGEWLHEDQGGDMLGHENSPMHQWPADGGWSVRVGKKAAGRLLDGRTHDEFPLTKLHAAEQEAREPSLFPPT